MKVEICAGSHCTLSGSTIILDQIEDLKEIISEDPDNFDTEELEVNVVKCLGFCKKTHDKISPVIVIDGEPIFHATGQVVMEKITTKLRKK